MEKPKIVCLCGSTKFYKTFQEQNLKLTLKGIIVLSIGCDTKSDEMINITSDDKIKLDELHKRKIDLCDEILVLNVDNYIGESTKSEIDYAIKINKPIKYMCQLTNIMDRCKTFDDLCRECDTTEKAFKEKFHNLGLDQDTIAYEMAKIMTRAFNKGKKVDYSDPTQKKWWPVHDLSSGCRFVNSYYRCGCTGTGFGPRLSFLDKVHSDYCANQFPEIFKYFLT